ncbi:MAG: phenylalanine--tRNA ligase subunit beta [Pseudomonadales bacterium]
MIISENWLREWVDTPSNSEQLGAKLTMAGLEVDAVEAMTAGFTEVVVGEITAIEQHPDADKLRVCQVSDGENTSQVVCGAPNARLGLKAPFAKVGAKLPGGMKIKKAKLRGIESMGMLCGETELELGSDDSGLMELAIDAPVGTAITDYLSLDDTLIELDITPNRGDCFSLLGVAREVGVIDLVDVAIPQCAAVAATIEDSLPIELLAAENCPQYAGRIIRNVDVSKPSPVWLQEKLRRAGIRSIDAVVDITNYVLLELGQPMHAFDLNKLDGGIRVRLSESGEKLTLLDEQELELVQGSLVIADHSGPQALAGIMGGLASSVTADTNDILLESAFFTPHLIAGKARSYGLHTDSSLRFERGVDYAGQVRAIERATALLLDIVGGEPGPVLLATDTEHMPTKAPIHLREERIQRVLGLSFAQGEVEELLTRLGFVVTEEEGGWLAVPPSWRFDVSIEVDLLEELARLYGYNRLPVSEPSIHVGLKGTPETIVPLADMRRQLVARGYDEAITYTFIAPELQRHFDPDGEWVELANPISADMAVMRTSLLPGLITTLQHNLNRQQHDIRLFESGLRFVKSDGVLTQDRMLAGLVTGRRQSESWNAASDKVDFFDIKGDIEAVLALSRCSENFSFVSGSRVALHPGQTAHILLGEQKVGYVGALHPETQAALDLDQPVYVFEVELGAIEQASLPEFAELSKFPEVRRDIAVIVDENLAAARLLERVRETAGETLTELTLFDVYAGKGIEKQRKSLALGLTFQHSSRTLKDDEINNIMDRVVQTLESEFGAALRN